MWKTVAIVGGAIAVAYLITREAKPAIEAPVAPGAEVCEFRIWMADSSTDFSVGATDTLLLRGTIADTNAALKLYREEIARRGKAPARPPCNFNCIWRLERRCYVPGQPAEPTKIDFLAHN